MCYNPPVMKEKFTTAEIIALVSEEKSNYREFRTAPNGKKYELNVFRSGLGQIWVWACENYVKPQSKSFGHWTDTKGWNFRCKNRFVEIVD